MILEKKTSFARVSGSLFGDWERRKSWGKKVLPLIALAAAALFLRWLLPTYYSLPSTITIPKWGGIASVEKKLTGVKRREFMYARWSLADELPVIQPWTYRFSGSVTFEEIVDVLKAWPSVAYIAVTVLEGRSSYDIDAMLVQQWLIEEWAYRKAITNPARIADLSAKYSFLGEQGMWSRKLISLEGFLYPDTYNLDAAKDPIDQLIYLQLENRKKKIWQPYQQQLNSLTTYLKSQGYTFGLTMYDWLVLASIVQKEERQAKNKPDIMSVFYNRLQNGMQLDADISLCYGLERPYSACTPSVIVENLRDTENKRNTRARKGIPPTPIANPDKESITALFTAKKTLYLFYLHDTSGILHLSKDLSEHEMNKSKYLD